MLLVYLYLPNIKKISNFQHELFFVCHCIQLHDGKMKVSFTIQKTKNDNSYTPIICFVTPWTLKQITDKLDLTEKYCS